MYLYILYIYIYIWGVFSKLVIPKNPQIFFKCRTLLEHFSGRFRYDFWFLPSFYIKIKISKKWKLFSLSFGKILFLEK